jgi:hypothetical protein
VAGCAWQGRRLVAGVHVVVPLVCWKLKVKTGCWVCVGGGLGCWLGVAVGSMVCEVRVRVWGEWGTLVCQGTCC